MCDVRSKEATEINHKSLCWLIFYRKYLRLSSTTTERLFKLYLNLCIVAHTHPMCILGAKFPSCQAGLFLFGKDQSKPLFVNAYCISDLCVCVSAQLIILYSCIFIGISVIWLLLVSCIFALSKPWWLVSLLLEHLKFLLYGWFISFSVETFQFSVITKVVLYSCLQVLFILLCITENQKDLWAINCLSPVIWSLGSVFHYIKCQGDTWILFQK